MQFVPAAKVGIYLGTQKDVDLKIKVDRHQQTAALVL
jgi:hypothetical protein